ncbi:hypothetical protein ACHQM5_023482 [Ranunculus cassubicifolius]
MSNKMDMYKHGMLVLRAAMENPNARFPFPPEGKYYVVDAGYANTKGFLAPYRGVRYHLKKFEGKKLQPKNKEELFNYTHSSLRNVIERCFGVLKARFPILTLGLPFSFETQGDIVIAACVLHNYIRIVRRDDWLFRKFENMKDVDVENDTEQVEVVAALPSTRLQKIHQREASALRDAITSDLWNARN